jgi:hypothetical protein
MVRNQLTPKCNRSNRCSFTKTPLPGVSQCSSVINCSILCQYGSVVVVLLCCKKVYSLFFEKKRL